MNAPSAIAAVVPTPQVLSAAGHRAAASLEPYERARMASLRTKDTRADFLAAHWLVRVLAGRSLGVVPSSLALSQRCPTCGGAHGPPALVGRPAIHISLSHARGLVGAAVASAPIAIDVEHWDALRAPELLNGAPFTPGERAAFAALAAPLRPASAARLWVFKECLTKLGRLSLDDYGKHDLAPLLAVPPSPLGLAHDGIAFSEWTAPTGGASAAVATSQAVSIMAFVPD